MNLVVVYIITFPNVPTGCVSIRLARVKVSALVSLEAVHMRGSLHSLWSSRCREPARVSYYKNIAFSWEDQSNKQRLNIYTIAKFSLYFVYWVSVKRTTTHKYIQATSPKRTHTRIELLHTTIHLYFKQFLNLALNM